MGRIYCVMGKSATGKDHIYRALLEDASLRLTPIVLYTTRPQREGEINGKEYYFTDISNLERLRAAGRIIEERVYATVSGDWYYFTADEGQIDPEKEDYLTIGTLDSYEKLKNYFGPEAVCPVYIETGDAQRLMRAISREQKQKTPKFREVCRRFLADEEDFSEQKLEKAGIVRRFANNTEIEDCIQEVRRYIMIPRSKAHGTLQACLRGCQ